MKKIYSLLTLSFLLFFAACDDSSDSNPSPSTTSTTSSTSSTGSTGSTTSGTGGGQYWLRNDGMGNAYLHLYGSTAKACNNGTETVGTYNSGEPSMTFVIQGNTLKFKLEYEDGQLWVLPPGEYTNTHNTTPYKKVTNYPCNGSGSTTAGTTGSTTSTTGSTTSTTGSTTASTTGSTTSTTGSTTGNTMGQAMFWTASDLGCGPISVNVNGQGSRTITSYYYSGVPDCGDSGNANYTLPAGNYSYSASCDSKTWSGSITVNAGGCSTMRLY